MATFAVQSGGRLLRTFLWLGMCGLAAPCFAQSQDELLEQFTQLTEKMAAAEDPCPYLQQMTQILKKMDPEVYKAMKPFLDQANKDAEEGCATKPGPAPRRDSAEKQPDSKLQGVGGSRVNPGVPRCVGAGCYWDGNRCSSELGGGTCTVGGSAPSPAPQSPSVPGSLSNGPATTNVAAQRPAGDARQQPAAPVSRTEKSAPFGCLVLGQDASIGILENGCAFPIDVTYCNQKGSDGFRCAANQYGSFTIAANGRQTTAYSASNGRFYYVVCRSPYSASGADRRWNGTSILASCQ